MNQNVFSLFMGYGDGFSFPFYKQVAQEAEKFGFETIWTQDNIAGHSPIPRTIEILDTWSFLSAIAASTSLTHASDLTALSGQLGVALEQLPTASTAAPPSSSALKVLLCPLYAAMNSGRNPSFRGWFGSARPAIISLTQSTSPN